MRHMSGANRRSGILYPCKSTLKEGILDPPEVTPLALPNVGGAPGGMGGMEM